MKNRLNEIPTFQPEDFETAKPYEYVYNLKDDPFQCQLVMAAIKNQAKAAGIGNFVTMFNAFVRSQAMQGKVKLERVTEFDRQPMALSCGPYICDEKGVRLITGGGEEIVVCPHPIMPIRRLINEDTGEERLLIAYRKGQYWRPPIPVEKSTIASAQKIIDLASFGVIVTSETAKLLGTFLLKLEELNYTTLEERRSVGRLGWIGAHGFAPYIDELEFDGETNYRNLFNAVRHNGSRDKWVNAMRAVRAEKTIARIFLAASFASALLEPCGLLPFFVHAWGGTGTGKTVSLMIAASVWANPRMGEYVGTFNSTDVGQEMTAAFLNSLPYCMDELQIQAASGQKDFDRVIYKLTEGVGKIRGAKGGGLRQTATWKNCILTTGEDPILTSSSMSGASIRVIEIEAEKPIYSDLVGICGLINQNYGFAGEEFVRYIQSTGVLERIEGIRMGYYRQLMERDGAEKQAASMSAILAADEAVTDLIFHDGNNLTVDDMAIYITKAETVSANRRALDYIYDTIARNPGKFLPLDKGPAIEIWGKTDMGTVSIIKSVFDRLLYDGGFNPRTFLSWAARQTDRNGVALLQTERGRTTKSVRLGEQKTRCVCLAADWGADPFEEDDTGDQLPF